MDSHGHTLGIGDEKCSDLVLSALVRAHFCELIAPKVEHGMSDLFLMRMLSLMDAILELPMGVVIEGLPLDPNTKTELLQAKIGRETPLTPIYHLMLAREAGDWEDITSLAEKLKLSLPCVNRGIQRCNGMGSGRDSGIGGAAEVSQSIKQRLKSRRSGAIGSAEASRDCTLRPPSCWLQIHLAGSRSQLLLHDQDSAVVRLGSAMGFEPRSAKKS